MGFHALTACDTTSAFSGHGKRSCGKTFQNHPHLVQGIGRDGELALIEQFVYHLYAHLSSQRSKTSDSNTSVRPSLVWRCYPQPETPWNFTPHTLTIKQSSGCRQTRSIYTSLLPPHLCMDDGVRLLEYCLNKITCYSRCVSRVGHLWMQS